MPRAPSASLKSFPRVVAIVGLAAIALVTGLVAYLQVSMGRAQIVASGETFNQTLAVAVSRVVSTSLARALELEKSTGVIHPEVKRALDETFAVMGAESRVLKVKLYNLAGATIYSTNPKDVGQSRYDNPHFRRAREGASATAHGFRATFQGISQVHRDREVAFTYLPLWSYAAGRSQIGVVEIYSDITSEIAASNRSVVAVLAVSIPCLLAFYGLLLVLVTRHARAIDGAHQRNLRLAADVALANAASDAKTHFLMTVSHELRTPLNAVLGFSQMMKDEVLGPLGNPRYVGYAGDVHAAGAHLLALIDEIIDATALHARRITLELAPCDCVALTKEVLEGLEGLAAGKQQSLRLLRAQERIVSVTDSRRFRQILYNLVGNALKFSGVGAVVALTLDSDAAKSALVIRVSDNGPGIAEADLEKCLTPFGQAKGGATTSQGLGLGLSISKTLAEALGGSLALDSAKGIGTTVTVTLPLRAAANADPAEAAPSASPLPLARGVGGIRRRAIATAP